GLEHRFRSGRLDGLASTSALELGINVGGVDATVLLGYPGQRQSFWQRIGRAGRDGSRSLAVMVADRRTLDQYVCSTPEYLLENDVEDAVVDTENDAVFARHVLCAADELPLDASDVTTEAGGGADDTTGGAAAGAPAFADRDRLARAIEMWRRAGRVEGDLAAGASYSGPPRPQTEVNLYATTDVEYVVRTPGDVPEAADPDLEPLARSRVYRDYHEGAVRLHAGRQYRVVDVSHAPPQPTVTVRPVDVDYYTRTRRDVTVLDATSEASREVEGFTLHRGEGRVLVHHATYDRVAVDDNETLAQGLDTGLPPLEMETQLCWVEVPDDVGAHLFSAYAGEDPAGHAEGSGGGVDATGAGTGATDAADAADPGGPAAHLGYAGALHAAEHAMIKTAPLELLVDKNDLGGLSTLVLDGHLATEAAGGEATAGVEGPTSGDDAPQTVAAARAAVDERRPAGGDASADGTGAPTSGWFVYDGVEGGLGFSRAMYEQFEAVAARARASLAECDCGRPDGCPACTMDANCGNDNAPLHRPAAVAVFDHLLGNATVGPSSGEAGPAARPTVFFS
ncbi:MAG: Zn-binding domain-containing protein, partial [Halobacteriaceae archaeon]